MNDPREPEYSPNTLEFPDRNRQGRATIFWQECYAWFIQDGWHVSDQAQRGPNGQLEWIVTGTNGDRQISTKASTRSHAWERARQEALSMVRPGTKHSSPISLN